MEVITSLVPYQVGDFPCQRFDVVAIIDVLRATTTLLFAVKAEAKRIIPVATVDEAFEIKYELTSENVLLCGERGGKIVPGFDLGNSPLEYTPEKVKGKTLIYASTNGSVLMRRAESLSDKIFLVSLRNITAAADRIISTAPKRMLIACAGKEGMSSLEDTYAAGFLIDKLRSMTDVELVEDGGNIAHTIFKYFGLDAMRVFESSVHGRYLRDELGLEKDLELAAEIDADNIVPMLVSGEVVG